MVFVVDAKVGTTDGDEQVVPILRKSGKPVLLVANKVDDVGTESGCGIVVVARAGEPYPVSALHGRGSGDLPGRNPRKAS